MVKMNGRLFLFVVMIPLLSVPCIATPSDQIIHGHFANTIILTQVNARVNKLGRNTQNYHTLKIDFQTATISPQTESNETVRRPHVQAVVHKVVRGFKVGVTSLPKAFASLKPNDKNRQIENQRAKNILDETKRHFHPHSSDQGGRNTNARTAPNLTPKSRSKRQPRRRRKFYDLFISNLNGSDYDLVPFCTKQMLQDSPRQERYKLVIFPDYIADHTKNKNKAKWILKFKNFTTGIQVSRNDIRHFSPLHIKLSAAVNLTNVSYVQADTIFMRVHLRHGRQRTLISYVTTEVVQPVQWVRMELSLTTGQDILNSLKAPHQMAILKVTCKRRGGRKCDFIGPVDRDLSKKKVNEYHSNTDSRYRPYLEITYLSHAW